MTIVVDSNIFVAYWLTDEPLHNEANQALSTWRRSGENLAAPNLFRSEITAVIRKAVFQRRVTHEEGRYLLAEILAYPNTFHDDDALLNSAYELAFRFNRPRAYDSQYMALAERLDCDFWTADQVLVNSVQTRFIHIHWLGDFIIPDEDDGEDKS